MHNLEKVILQYLREDSDYAILLTGKWVSGKTHFYRHILKPLILETPTLNDDHTTYTAVTISVFGLRSVEEIQSELFVALYPLLKNPAIKFTGQLAKGLLTSGLKYLRADDVAELIEKVKLSPTSEKMKSAFVCFDDLERRHPSLDFTEFTGYVNKLTENDGVKVLIIANEEELKDERFKALKEKVVGNVLEFMPDTITTLRSILNSKYSGDRVYCLFIEERLTIVMECFRNEPNFRIFSFFLQRFYSVFRAIDGWIDERHTLSENKTEALEFAFRYALAISIEFREGRITYRNDNGIRKLSNWLTRQLIAEHNKEQSNQESPEKIFRERYFLFARYEAFQSIYDFLTNGDGLNVDLLTSEIRKLYDVEDEHTSPAYKVYNLLKHPQQYEHSDISYVRLTRQLLAFAEQGQYPLEYYPDFLFYGLQRMSNPLGLKEDKLTQRLLKGMRRGSREYSYSLENYFDHANHSNRSDNYKTLVSEAIRLNASLKQTAEKQTAIAMEKLFYTTFKQFFRELSDEKTSYQTGPFFQHFNFRKFTVHLKKCSPDQRHDIRTFFAIRYKNSRPDLANEKPFLVHLHNQVDSFANAKKNRNVSGTEFRSFADQLQKIIERQ